MNEWIDELSDLAAAGDAAVLVTISGIRGSTPRETGAKMIVTARETIGTIGGGQLEHQCTHIAAGLLETADVPETRRFPLGPALGQCCGGVMDVLFEPVAAGLRAELPVVQSAAGMGGHLSAAASAGRRALPAACPGC